MSLPVVVIGAGGHAKVVITALRAAGREIIACAVRDAVDAHGTLLGVPLISEVALPAGVELILGIGDNRLRARVAAKLGGPWTTCVHPAAVVAEGVVLGPGSVVCAGAVLQPDTRLGAHVIVNTSASVDHDSVLGDFAHIAPGAHLAGEVHIGEGTLVGVGAAIIPGRNVGAWAVVGAGAAVVSDVPDGTTVVGVPARPKKKRS